MDRDSWLVVALGWDCYHELLKLWRHGTDPIHIVISVKANVLLQCFQSVDDCLSLQHHYKAVASNKQCSHLRCHRQLCHSALLCQVPHDDTAARGCSFFAIHDVDHYVGLVEDLDEGYASLNLFVDLHI